MDLSLISNIYIMLYYFLYSLLSESTHRSIVQKCCRWLSDSHKHSTSTPTDSWKYEGRGGEVRSYSRHGSRATDTRYYSCWPPPYPPLTLPPILRFVSSPNTLPPQPPNHRHFFESTLSAEPLQLCGPWTLFCWIRGSSQFDLTLQGTKVIEAFFNDLTWK